MKLFIWRHNRKFHSWSMMNEPCVHEAFYTDAIAMVAAETQEEALQILESQQHGWRMEDVKGLTPKVIELGAAQVIFEEVRGD